MAANFDTLKHMTPQELKEARAQAKREFEAMLVLLDAVERYQQSVAPTLAPGFLPTQPRFNTIVEPATGMSREEAERLADTLEGYRYLDTAKDKILLAIHQNGGIRPTALSVKLAEVKATPEVYPASRISPKISDYRVHGLVEQRLNGWHVTQKGRDRIIQLIMMKKGPNRAA